MLYKGLMGWIFFMAMHPVKPLQPFRFNGSAQGTTYQVTYYAEDSFVVKSQLDSILNKIDSSLSLYKSYSLINEFNNSATGITVDDHFSKVVNAALETYQQTNGLFDITVYPLTEAWGFGPVKPKTKPDSLSVRQLLACVDSRLIYWDNNKLTKKNPCVKIDPNGIAQGYAVDVMADFLEKNGVRDYLVELGGEIRIKGRKHPSGEKMAVGIEAPGDQDDQLPIEKKIWIGEGAITTSGTYRRYHESNGKRISHLLNPLSGFPVENELISVSLYAKDAMTADAYDNALMAMGLNKALDFIEKRKDMAAFFIYRKKNGTVVDTMSSRFYDFLKR